MFETISAKKLLSGSLLILTTFVAASAQASSPIIPLQIAPDVIFPNTPTRVEVKAGILPEPSLIRSSVTVVRVDASGRKTIATRLYDDGTHGDVLSGDNVYSGELSLNEPTLADIQFLISAAYRGGLKRTTSQSLVVTVSRRPTTEEMRMTLRTEENAGRSFATLRKQMGDDRARAAVLADLRKQPNVASSGISSDGHTIWIRYSNGLESNILTGPEGTMGGPFRMFDGIATDPEFVSSSAALPNGGCGCGSQSQQAVKPVVLAPFWDQFQPYDASESVAKSLERTCLDSSYSGKVNVTKNSAVNLNAMKGLDKFNVIYINTHGGIDSKDQVIIATRESVTVLSRLLHFGDWLKGRITPAGIDNNQVVWAINPTFVDYHGKGKFKNAMVYLSACDTFGAGKPNLSLANAFLNNGAVTAYGWNETVQTGFASSTSIALFEVLTDPKRDAAARSAGIAFDGISPKTAPNPPNATFSMAGSRDLSLSVPSTNACPQVFVSTSLKVVPTNGSPRVGQVINGTFSLTNRGNAELQTSQVLIAGRLSGDCPNRVCPDFVVRPNVKLVPGQTYNYSGSFTPSVAGSYTFSVAYETPDGKWEMPVQSEKGNINKLSLVVLAPSPTLNGRSPDSIGASTTLQEVNLYGTKLRNIVYCSLKLNGQVSFLYMPLNQVFAVSDTQIRIRTKFLSPGTYYVTAWTMDGKSNEFPIVVR